MFGPDVVASVTTGELRQLVEGVRFIERMRAHPVDKDAAAGGAPAALRRMFTKSVVARVDLAGRHGAAARSTSRLEEAGHRDSCRPAARACWAPACVAPLRAGELLAARRSRGSGHEPTKGLRRRHRPSELQPHQDRHCGQSLAHPELELQLVVAASALLDRYGSAVRDIEHDGFRSRLESTWCSRARTSSPWPRPPGSGLLELATVFDNLRPDVVVTVADRYETIATAIAAAYMNIPVAHVQGGEVTGSIDEKVRHAVTKLADLHFVASTQAARARDPHGRRSRPVSSSPAVRRSTWRPRSSAIRLSTSIPTVATAASATGRTSPTATWWSCSIRSRPSTNWRGSRSLRRCTPRQALGVPVLWFWPNVDAGTDGTSNGIRAFRERENARQFHFFKNMTPEDFLRLLYNARCLVGNSSVGVRECSFLGVPVVNIGTRQAGRDRGVNVADVDYDRGAIANAIERHLDNGRYPQDLLYGDGTAGPRIADLLSEVPLRFEKRLWY